MFRIVLFALAFALASLAAAHPADAAPFSCSPVQGLNFGAADNLPLLSDGLAGPVPVAGWTLLGCWKSRPWVTTCFDVFRDDTGTLYICKACGTTGSPNKGKCRETTQAELNGGTWCGATQ